LSHPRGAGRVSEVLGLASDDLDLDAGTSHVRRASIYVDGPGQQLGPPKTEGPRGEHWLLPTVSLCSNGSARCRSSVVAADPVRAVHGG
jgi:hypothetical protein